MSSLTPTGLETITYGQQGWNAIITANMQRLNGWIGRILPLVNTTTRPDGAIPIWNASSGTWKPTTELSQEIASLQTELAELRQRITALEPPSQIS